jgi:hypothetical protein
MTVTLRDPVDPRDPPARPAFLDRDANTSKVRAGDGDPTRVPSSRESGDSAEDSVAVAEERTGQRGDVSSPAETFFEEPSSRSDTFFSSEPDQAT